eukprot:scaffold5696_cov119-Isochrysis_galbana.AAC.3
MRPAICRRARRLEWPTTCGRAAWRNAGVEAQPLSSCRPSTGLCPVSFTSLSNIHIHCITHLGMTVVFPLRQPQSGNLGLSTFTVKRRPPLVREIANPSTPDQDYKIQQSKPIQTTFKR